MATSPIAGNIARVRERMHAAARRAGRDPDEVSLMAVTKTHGPDLIAAAYASGLRLFGENRVQEFQSKREGLIKLQAAEWRLIGHLQTNKVGKAVELFQAIDSLDSLRLAEKLDAAAARANRILPVLIEINVGREASKHGIAPDSAELDSLLAAVPRLSSLAVRGLMTVPPFSEHPESARPFFRRLHRLRDEIAARKLPGILLGELSMGMSHDFEVAIEEGSTCIRLGTAIFGARPQP